jgi:predicted flap endonuclease-1-like 5' DNA nuclease
MLYLLTAFWEWFAVALLVGLAVGWLTTSRERGNFSGHGVVVTSAFALLGGFLIAGLQIVPGRAGFLLEFALLFLSVYAIGLPTGGGAKTLILGTAPAAPARSKPAIVAARSVPIVEKRDEPEPAAECAPEPEPAPTPAPAPVVEPPPVVSAAPPVASGPAPHAEPELEPTPAPAPRPAPAESAKKLPGQQPEGLPQPRGGKPDDLAKIKGVGPKSVEKLHALGVYHFDQIAAWTPDNVKWMSAQLAIPGRIERGKWVAQAKELAAVAAVAENNDVSTPAQ